MKNQQQLKVTPRTSQSEKKTVSMLIFIYVLFVARVKTTQRGCQGSKNSKNEKNRYQKIVNLHY